MEYREMVAKDLTSLLKLYAQLDPNNPELHPEQARAVWADIEGTKNVTYYVAEDGGEIVASCYLAIIPNLTRGGRPIGFVENVITDARYRRRGIGRAVLEMAIQRSKEMHCYKVILQSGMTRQDAHRFYESLGFDGNSKRAFDLRIE